MRWTRLVALSLSIVLVALLVACGGDSDDPTPTATSAPATATSPPPPAFSPTVPAAATATEDSQAGAGGGAGSGGPGSGGAEATATVASAGPTPTRRPATVVATPRPIATRPPQPTTPAQQATATPAPQPPTPTLEEGQLLIVMEEDFESGSSDWFDVGTTQYGTTLEIVAGAYVITPQPESWQTITVSPDDSWSFADGLITADFSMEGNGEFGLVSRQMQDDSGAFYFYLCWLTPSGAAGCSLYADGAFTLLFRVDDPSLYKEINTVVMQVIGTEIIYEVNGQQVGAIDDTTVDSGYWGFYVWGDENTATVRVDYTAIAVP